MYLVTSFAFFMVGGFMALLMRAELARPGLQFHSPGVGADLWIVGLVLSGLGTILGAVNMITTILTLRAPGMTMFRMPMFTWNILVTSLLVIMVFPILAAALLVLEADRHLGAHVYDADTGGAMLWQHLFWFFGHPEVYIVALP